MPWPMRIGPEPMTSTGFAADRRRLVLLLVGAVEVRRHRLELRGAGVDHLVDGAQVPVLAQVAHLLRQTVGQRADLHVGEAETLGVPEQVPASCGSAEQPPLHLDDVLQAVDEPGVDAGRRQTSIVVAPRRSADITSPETLVRSDRAGRSEVVQ